MGNTISSLAQNLEILNKKIDKSFNPITKVQETARDKLCLQILWLILEDENISIQNWYTDSIAYEYDDIGKPKYIKNMSMMFFNDIIQKSLIIELYPKEMNGSIWNWKCKLNIFDENSVSGIEYISFPTVREALRYPLFIIP